MATVFAGGDVCSILVVILMLGEIGEKGELLDNDEGRSGGTKAISSRVTRPDQGDSKQGVEGP
jgi:hypothetical protein